MSKYSGLKKKILFTILAVLFYRLGSHVALPTVDVLKLGEMMKLSKTGIFSMFNMFSGGSIGRMSIFVLGVMPYISASIVMQLLSTAYAPLKALKKEGGTKGAEKINEYTKYLTILICLFQAYAVVNGINSMGLLLETESPMYAKFVSVAIMTASTMILMWLGDQISLYGIGNGISIIIFTGIVAEAPKDVMILMTNIKSGSVPLSYGFLLFFTFIAMLFFVVVCERIHRLVYIQHPRQRHQMPGMPMQDQNFIPIKLNTAGVMPPIFANAILLLPATLISVAWSSSDIMKFFAVNFTHGKPLFIVVDLTMIIAFTYFYNSVLFDPKDIVENLKKSGAFIPGIRPGLATETYFQQLMKKLSFISAIYLCIVAGMPEFLSPIFGYTFLLGGTGLLIIVNVLTDVITQVQTHMLSGKYEKMMKKYNKIAKR